MYYPTYHNSTQKLPGSLFLEAVSIAEFSKGGISPLKTKTASKKFFLKWFKPYTNEQFHIALTHEFSEN